MTATIAILASGSGTTAEAFIRAGQSRAISTKVGLIICSRKTAGIFDRIKNLNQEFGLSIPCILINSQTHPAMPDEQIEFGQQTANEEAAILKLLTDGSFDCIVQMGYMKKTGPKIVNVFGWRSSYISIYEASLLNTHPGLLPVSKGLFGENIQKYVLENMLPFSGQTLHVVAEDYDEGPTVSEHKVAVENGDTSESLFARVQKVEKQYLPGDIESFIAAKQAYNKKQEKR